MSTDLPSSQKAAKQLAARNAAILRRLHLTSLAVNIVFILLRFVLFRSSCTRTTYILYLVLAAPALIIEFLFEKNGRPTHAPNGELKRSGDDLEAKGLTEYMFDVLYWTWGCTVAAAIFGDRGWWLWVMIPLYSIWLAWTTFGSVRQGISGMTGQGGEWGKEQTSNRQKKMEKKGGQRVQYR